MGPKIQYTPHGSDSLKSPCFSPPKEFVQEQMRLGSILTALQGKCPLKLFEHFDDDNSEAEDYHVDSNGDGGDDDHDDEMLEAVVGVVAVAAAAAVAVMVLVGSEWLPKPADECGTIL